MQTISSWGESSYLAKRFSARLRPICEAVHSDLVATELPRVLGRLPQIVLNCHLPPSESVWPAPFADNPRGQTSATVFTVRPNSWSPSGPTSAPGFFVPLPLVIAWRNLNSTLILVRSGCSSRLPYTALGRKRRSSILACPRQKSFQPGIGINYQNHQYALTLCSSD